MRHSKLKDEVVLSPQALSKIRRDIKGKGGFQSLLRALSSQIEGDRLRLTPTLRERIVRYATKYGLGGFEDRLGNIIPITKGTAEKEIDNGIKN